MHAAKLTATLRRLRESGVEFVLVGGLAAVLNGAPIQNYLSYSDLLSHSAEMESR